MIEIIKNYWGDIWSKRDDNRDDKQINNYIDSHPTKISNHLLPKIPDIDEIEDTINGSSNSSPGPNGIPFSILRHFSQFLAPIIHNIITSLSHGIPPPDDFNFGILHLFPKNHSLEIKDTRPITISNTINRIIAKILTNSIIPATQETLHPQQKGFIPGRSGRDHITQITQKFYSAMGRKKQMFLLFLDTKKAFDSIDHNFIFLTLEKIGLPLWFINSIKGLLHNVIVFPAIARSTDPKHGIKIERGVKQGCPLSPILFAICYDVLLHKLEEKNKNDIV